MPRKFLNGIDLQSQRIQNVAAASQPSDAVTLAQLQSALAGLSWHGAVRAASTGNVTLSSPGASLDGVNLAPGNRILLKNQSTASENGVHIWNGASAALTRAADGVTGMLNAGAAFYVDEGTVNADTAWTLTTDDPVTVGSTALAFAKFGAGVAYTAAPGGGLTLSGSAFSADFGVLARHTATNVGDGSSTSYTISHNLGTLDVIVQVFLNGTGETVEADVTRPSTNTVAIAFASAPASGAYRAVVMG